MIQSPKSKVPSPKSNHAGVLSWFAVWLVSLLLAGCATTQRGIVASHRPFNFEQDTFAYANGLVWEYYFDAQGKWTNRRREPAADYTHHCFVVARSARQFFLHARFDESLPVADETACRRLIREVISRSPRHSSSPSQQVVIPGYPHLKAFSQEWAELLKAECGGAWQSYFQRGHWRMILPFGRRHQERTAGQLLESVRQHDLPVVHLVRFPSLSINHAVVAFDAEEDEAEIRFAVYDPNEPAQPTELVYERSTRSFSFPCNFYFIGGRVHVYEIYCGWLY